MQKLQLHFNCSAVADMVLKSLKLFIPILSLIYFHVYGNILFEVKDVPKAEWLACVNRKIVVKSPVECAIRCNKMYDWDMSCNSILFDESDNTCTLAQYLRREAWASSVDYNNDPCFAIDMKIGDNFFSTKDNTDDYPWLAIDLVRPEKVGKVEIKSRSGYERRTHDIEVRVGHEEPFARDTNRDTLYTSNTVCGFDEGPATSGSDFVIECTPAIEGRYVTIQRIKISAEPSLNIVEVLFETEPVDAKMMETIKVLERSLPLSGKGNPFTYEGGSGAVRVVLITPPPLHYGSNSFLQSESYYCQTPDLVRRTRS